mmetsp:Transcript_6368/g.16196  ORF Transcript_6368/g.16196 Transcript_6368/m.16196 type:complete len:301 (+) Transcript_6368:318-1220(+)
MSIHPQLVHRLQSPINLGASLKRRRVVALVDARRPLPVQVRAGGVDPQVAGDGPVGIHVRDEAHRRDAPQLARQRVFAAVEEAPEALGAPLGHGLAGVLARRRPKLERSIPEGQQVQRPPLKRLSNRCVCTKLARPAQLRHEALVPLPGVGREVGKPNGVALRLERPRQLPVLVLRRGDPEPVLAVVGRHGLVVFPALGVRCGAGVFEDEGAFLAFYARGPEVEPLEVGGLIGTVRIRIRADLQRERVGVVRAAGDVFYFYVAAVEGGADARRPRQRRCRERARGDGHQERRCSRHPQRG